MLASILVVLLVGASTPAPQSPREVIVEIHVRGNHVTSDVDIVALSGLVVGGSFDEKTIAGAAARLRAARRFDDVDVVKRFASIEDPSRISIVIVVNEGPVRLEVPSVPAAAIVVVPRRGFRNLMFLPILDGEDGHGVTYGVRVSRPDVAGTHSRLSFPLSWGGHKQAAIEFDRTWQAAPVSRVRARVGLDERTNPFFHEDDRRRTVLVRGEKAAGPVVAGVDAAWQRVTFGERRERVRSVAVDLVVDTRLDPLLARNAVYASMRIERLKVAAGAPVTRRRMEGRGHLGLIGQSVLVIGIVRDDSSVPLPPYLQPLLGGWSNLRGFKAGAVAGDVVVTGVAELRMPVSSSLSIGKLVLSTFIDTGVAYALGERLRDQSPHTGVGAAAIVSVTAFRMSLSLARGLGASTRVNFSGGFYF